MKKLTALLLALLCLLAFAACTVQRPDSSSTENDQTSPAMQLPAYQLFSDASVELDDIYIDINGFFRLPATDGEWEAFYAFDALVEKLAAAEFAARDLGTPHSTQVRWRTPEGSFLAAQDDPISDPVPAHFSVDPAEGRSPMDLDEDAALRLVQDMIFCGTPPYTVASQIRVIFPALSEQFPDFQFEIPAWCTESADPMANTPAETAAP